MNVLKASAPGLRAHLQAVTPIFSFLAQQVSAMGSKEIGTRIAYDDCNESLARRDVVHSVLKRLGVSVEQQGRKVAYNLDPYSSLLEVGAVSLTVEGSGASAKQAEVLSSVGLSWDPANAKEWWKRFVFGKTFVERRSIFSIYRCACGGNCRCAQGLQQLASS